MAQDQIIYNQVNAIFQGQDTLKKAVKQLVTATLTCKLDELPLSRLSDEEVTQLRDTLQTWPSAVTGEKKAPWPTASKAGRRATI